MLGSPHGGGANVVYRYHQNQTNSLAGEAGMAGIQSSIQAPPQASTLGTGLLTRFVSPSAISSSHASAINNSNSKSLPNIPSAIGRHLSGSKVFIFIYIIIRYLILFYTFNFPTPSKLFLIIKDPYLNKVGRRSPPAAHSAAANSARSTPGHHSAMLVRRSKSSAILPLRKHLIEKTLMEQKAMDEEQQLHFQQKDKVYLFRIFVKTVAPL